MKEQTRHRRAFDLYVRLGASRSLDALCQALERDPAQIGVARAPSQRTIEAWSAAFHWQDRVADLEHLASERDREDQLAAVREMHDRHVREGMALQQKGVERLQQLPAGELSAADAVRALVEGVRLERLARGVPTETIRQERELIHGHLDLRNFSNEELRRLVELAEQRTAGTGDAESG
jgi:hypothetical protein